VPRLHGAFATFSLGGRDWVLVIALAFTVVPVIEAVNGWNAARGSGRPRGAAATEPIDQDAIEHWLIAFGPCRDPRRRRQPPFRPALEQCLRACSRGAVLLRMVNLVVASGDDNRGPVELIDNIFDFNTYFGIGAHPVNLSPDRGEAVQTAPIAIEREKDRDDVRLVVSRAGQPTETAAREYFATLIGGQFVNDHQMFGG
jgi:hypothetical protein